MQGIRITTDSRPARTYGDAANTTFAAWGPMEGYSTAALLSGEATEGTAMTIRRITAPMLYTQSAPGRWLSSLTAAMDEAAAGWCRTYWQQGRLPICHPVRIALRQRRAP